MKKKCIVIGDSAVGKTELIVAFTKKKTPETNEPQSHLNYSADINIDGLPPVNLEICDTSGMDVYGSIRKVLYRNIDAILLCFSRAELESFENIKKKWMDEIQECCPGKPIILAGLQSDRRDEFKGENGGRFITTEMGEELAMKINACDYLECSSPKFENVDEVFEAVVKCTFCDNFGNCYIIGKDTPNKLNFVQMIRGKRNGRKFNKDTEYTIRSIPEEDVDKITKEEKDGRNQIYYVYNVDDRVSFEKYEEIHKMLKEKFNTDNDKFVLCGINVNIENERSVSFEELIATAFKNESFYFELQKFNSKVIGEQLYNYSFSNEATYISGLERSGYREVFNNHMKKLFNEYKICRELFIPKKIEEIELEKILDSAINEEKKIRIYFVYSPFYRETLAAIEDIFSKCANIQKYYKLPIYLLKNELIDSEGKTEEVTAFDTKRICLKKRIKSSDNFEFNDDYNLEKNEGEIIIHIEDDKASIEDYNFDKCSAVKSGDFKIKESADGARIYIVNLTKDIDHISVDNAEDNNYIIAGDLSDIKYGRLEIERENLFLEKLKPEQKQHFITFNKKEIENVLMQYIELQEHAKETFHIFCNNGYEEKLLDSKSIGFVNEEECKLVRFGNHICKYKVEFHDEYSFTEEMQHIVCFVSNDDESQINIILESFDEIKGPKNDICIVLENTQEFDKDKEQELIEHLENKYVAISKFIPIPKIESYEDFCVRFEDIFTYLREGVKRGEEEVEHQTTKCRI